MAFDLMSFQFFEDAHLPNLFVDNNKEIIRGRFYITNKQVKKFIKSHNNVMRKLTIRDDYTKMFYTLYDVGITVYDITVDTIYRYCIEFIVFGRREIYI